VISAAINFNTTINPFAMNAPIKANIYSLPGWIKVTRIRFDYAEKIGTKQQHVSRAERRAPVRGGHFAVIILFPGGF
jgi:hypothetical protein